MAAQIDYHFTLISPFAYLGHAAFIDLARRHGAAVAYRPVNLFDLFATVGAVPLPQRPPARQAYRLIELQRIAFRRGLPLTLKPKHFPTNPTLANGAVVAILAGGGDPDAFVRAAYAACWVHEQDIADPDTVAALLDRAGHDPDSVLARAQAPETAATLAANTEAALAAGALGSPTYVLAGEPFWGQDRLDDLDHALVTGRAPFRAS